MNDEELGKIMAELVHSAPPLTDDQIERIAALLRPYAYPTAEPEPEWDTDDPMPEMIETEADHGADAIYDGTGFVIGQLVREARASVALDRDETHPV